MDIELPRAIPTFEGITIVDNILDYKKDKDKDKKSLPMKLAISPNK